MVDLSSVYYLCALAAFIAAGLACIGMVLAAEREQASRFDALEDEYRWQRYSEHTEREYVDNAPLPHFDRDAH